MLETHSSQARIVLSAVALLAGSAYGQTYSPIYAPDSSIFNGWQCIYDGTTTGVPYALFTVVSSFYSNSNSHYHNANRPKSSIQCTTDYSYSCLSATQGNAAADGSFSFNQNATIVGQAESLTITCQDIYNTGATTTLNTDYAVGYNDVFYNDHPQIWVRIGGTDTGVNTGHGSTYYNRYMKLNPDRNSGPAYGLYYATLDYLAVHPEISQICTNDMALPFGGKFDLNQDWQQPHSQHDRGTAVDVAAIGTQQCANAGGSGVNVSEFISYCVYNGASSTYSFPEPLGPQTTLPHAHCGWEAPTWPH